MKKRDFLKYAGGLAAVGAVLTSNGASVQAQQGCVQADNPATFVLVHGAWHGGFCFNGVAELLRARGHRVFTPTLSGLAERAYQGTEGVTLDTHIEDIIELLRFEELSNIVLAGHSYGGMVITGVADRIPDRIASLVYLDAVVPEDGVRVMDVVPNGREQVEALIAAGATGAPFPPELAGPFSIPQEDLWKYTPQPMGAFTQPIRLTDAYLSVPKKTFVMAGKWPTFQSTYDVLSVDPAWSTDIAPTGHLIMTEAPEYCVDVLEGAV